MNDAAAATAAAVADAYEPAKARLEELSGLLAAAGITAAFQLPREDAEALDRTIAKLTDDTENFQASGEDARKVIELLLQAGLGENDPLVVALTNIAGMLDAISAKAEGARDSLKRLNAQTEANDAMSRRQRQERGLPELPDTAPAPERRVDLYFQDPVSTGRKVGKAAGEEITNSLQTFLTGGKGRSSVEGFNKDFAERLNAFLKNAPGRGISIYSGYRTVERQAELWEAALRKYGSPAAARKWVAPPGSSMHNKGGAADLRFASDEARRWAHENAALYGLNFRMGHEPWHIEAAEGVGRMSDDYLEMAGNADAAKVAVQGYTDAQRLAQQQAQQFAGIAQNFFGGLVNDLIAGKDASEAFRNAIAQLTSQLLQMVMNQAINAFFNQMFGVGAGGFPAAPLGGGGLYHGGGTVGLSGRQDGRQFAPGTWAGAPRFASGGMVGLRPGEVPIIAHRGEIIVPNARRLASSSGGGRVDNSVHQQNKISIDMSGSGYVAANSANAKQLGEDIQKMIEVKLVRESRPGGLLRAVPK
jgi:hypothetical protein